MNKQSILYLFSFCVLMLIALGLRLFGLSFQPLWWDEGFSLYFATESPLRLLELTSLDIHPPFYYLLLQAWMALVGIGALAARWFSVLLGVLALPVAWGVARPLIGVRGAWMTTWLLALSPLHVFYSQEVRMYGLLTLLALLAVWAWQRSRWILLGVVVAAGMLTHYYFLFMAFALALLILNGWRLGGARKGHYNRLRGPLSAVFVIIIGNTLWLIYALPRLIRYLGCKLGVEADTPMTPLEFFPRHLVAWSVGHLEPGWTWLAWATWLFVGLLLLGLRQGHTKEDQKEDKSSNYNTTLLILWAVPTLCVFCVGLLAPFVAPRIERQLLFVLPFFLMLVAQGIVVLWRRSSLGVVALLLLITFINLASLWGFYSIPRYPGEDYRPILADVGALQGAGDGWLAIYEWQIGYLRAYLPDAHPTPLLVPGTTPGADNSISCEDQPEAREAIEAIEAIKAREAGVAELLNQHQRIWLPAYQVKGRFLEEDVARVLSKTGAYAWNDWYGNTRLYLFGRGAEVPALEIAGNFEGVGEVRAAIAQVPAPTLGTSSGIGIVPLFIEMDQMPDQVPQGVRASVQLHASDLQRGGVWGEWDGAIAVEPDAVEENDVVDALPEEESTQTGRLQVRAGLPVDHGTPPGEYLVQLTLYRAADGEPLNRVKDGVRTTPDATIGQITVIRPPTTLPAAALRRLATTPFDLSLGESVQWLGASVSEADGGSWLQGDRVPITLFWQSHLPIANDLNVFLQAIDKEGTPHALRDLSPVNGTFPTTQWEAGDLVRDPHKLYLPADMPAGDYRLIAGLYDPAQGSRLSSPDGQDAFELGTIQVEARTRLFEEPRIGSATDIPFGERARLAQQQIPNELQAGVPLKINLLWQATATGGTNLRAFVQLYHNEEQLDSSDHELDPPASAWINGEWIVDEHHVVVPADLVAGNYKLVVGMYEAESGVMVPTPEGMWATVAEWNVGK